MDHTEEKMNISLNIFSSAKLTLVIRARTRCARSALSHKNLQNMAGDCCKLQQLLNISMIIMEMQRNLVHLN